MSDPAHLHEVHPRSGHHDLLRRTDPQPDADAQRWLRPTHRLGVHVCQPAAAHRDGRHGDRPSERHLSHIRRWASQGASAGRWALSGRGVQKEGRSAADSPGEDARVLERQRRVTQHFCSDHKTTLATLFQIPFLIRMH